MMHYRRGTPLGEREIKQMRRMRPYNTVGELARYFGVNMAVVEDLVAGIEGPVVKQTMAKRMAPGEERRLSVYEPYIHNFLPEDVVNRVGREADVEEFA